MTLPLNTEEARARPAKEVIGCGAETSSLAADGPPRRVLRSRQGWGTAPAILGHRSQTCDRPSSPMRILVAAIVLTACVGWDTLAHVDCFIVPKERVMTTGEG